MQDRLQYLVQLQQRKYRKSLMRLSPNVETRNMVNKVLMLKFKVKMKKMDEYNLCNISLRLEDNLSKIMNIMV